MKGQGSTSLPIPPLAEQHRIVANVDALMELCNKLEAATNATESIRARLLEFLLHESFVQEQKDLEAA